MEPHSWPRPPHWGRATTQDRHSAPHLVLLDQLLDGLQVAPVVFQHGQWEAVLDPVLKGEGGRTEGGRARKMTCPQKQLPPRPPFARELALSRQWLLWGGRGSSLIPWPLGTCAP